MERSLGIKTTTKTPMIPVATDDSGANVRAKSPAPAGNATGKETAREYDSAGRLLKESVLNTGAYTRYEYPANNIRSKFFATLVDTDNDGADADDEVMSEAWTDGAGRVRRSRTEHPGSTGGWAATLAEYDILGQVGRSTVPTEVSVGNPNDPATWTPAGDDDRGTDPNGRPVWLWNSTEYDWKGRVTRTVPTDSNGSDGKDQLISYEGCGCAGGQMTTVQGPVVPRDDDPNQTARRTQKVYEDILGRTYKTEVLNWTGGVYTTTVQTFNARDQVTRTRQHAGDEISTNYQDVTMTYDGHGRMKTRHYPIEDANTDTTWIYNPDDSVQQVIDPRGAIANLVYENRGLVTQVSFQVPPGSGVSVTPTSTFAYDAARNRIAADASGVVQTTYSFDSLSRTVSETALFDDLPNSSYSISYQYNLAGTLKSVTDPFGSAVTYDNDRTGRVASVRGSPWAQNLSGNWASGIRYRAFGQVGQMDFDLPGETANIVIGYDEGMRVSRFEATSAAQPGGHLLRSDFNYANDGRVAGRDDLIDGKWDRTMKYDFAGRLTFNQFGIGIGSDHSAKRVYEQSIAYDAYSQMTSRNGVHWNRDIGFTATYVNGRKQDGTLTYDAAGNVVAENRAINEFQTTDIDAAGRRTAFLERWHTDNGPQSTFIVWENRTEQSFDADGRPVIERRGVRQVGPNSPPLTTAVTGYQVWSSVLGASLTKLSPAGAKEETKVFAGGMLIARQRALTMEGQNFDSVEWAASDPVTGAEGRWHFSSLGASRYTEEAEPLGQRVANDDPADAPPPVYETHVGGASDPEWQCRVPQEFYGGFQALPEHCQMSVLRQLTKGLDEIYGFTPRKSESHPGRIVTVGPDRPHGPAGHGKADALRARALVSTAREPSDDTGLGHDGEIGIGTFTVDIKNPGPDPIEFNNAEFGGDNSWTADPPPPPPSDCKLWVSDYYSILRSRFDAIWNNHMATVTKDNPWGVEKGGVVSLHPERLDPATRQEETAVDHFDGPDGDRYSMSEDFNPWVIETKRKRGLDGWLRVAVHTHPGLDRSGTPDSPKVDGISPGDFRNAPSSPGFEAVITPTKIFLYTGTGEYKEKDFILCEIDRETGRSRSLQSK